MYKLIAVTLAALYAVLLIFGDEARRPAEVARAEPLDLSVLAVSALPELDEQQTGYVSERSDREAIEMAIAAGKKFREETRPASTAQREVAPEAIETATTEVSTTPAQPEPDYWYVTGTRVNLRGGPGTSNAVVGQVTLGAEAEILADQDGWYQIRLADGSISGWIFGQFLNADRPG